MKNTIIYSLVALMAVVLLQPSAAQAEEIDLSGMEQADMLELIEQLTAQVAELREQLDAQRAEMQEFREEVRAGLSQGMRDEDVRKLQELLASDPDIYPERLTTGYFGPLTSQALSRLQQRHDLPATGELDEDTRDLINQYFAERTGREDAPEGLLRAPGIMQAVERGVCERGRGNRPFCPQVSEENDEDSDGESASGRPDHAGRPEHDNDDSAAEDEVADGTDVSQADARTAIAGAHRGIDYVQDAISNAPRAVNVMDMRRTLREAQREHRTAERAYRNDRYAMAYESARTARQLAARALDMLPERAMERERVREAVENFARERDDTDREVTRDDEEEGELRACGLDELESLVGTEITDRDDVIERWEAYQDDVSSNRSVRFLNPGDAMTMDYIETRLNVFFDEDGVVERVTCG